MLNTSAKVIRYPEMVQGCLICLLMMGSFLIQVQSVDVMEGKLQNTSVSVKTEVTEQHSKLTPPDKKKINLPAENKSTITNTTYNIEHFMTFPNDLSSVTLLRGFYVFVGLGAIVVTYIVVRTIRLRKKKRTVRKYGILANREDVEMTPLGAEDEEEEESTLFDLTAHNSRS